MAVGGIQLLKSATNGYHAPSSFLSVDITETPRGGERGYPRLSDTVEITISPFPAASIDENVPPERSLIPSMSISASDQATAAVLQALHTLYHDPEASSKRRANEWLEEFQHSVSRGLSCYGGV